MVMSRLHDCSKFFNNMEKISLYDQENEKVYDVMLSAEDARRAASDMTFATSLLNAAILDENSRTGQNEISNVINVENVQSHIMPEACNVQDSDDYTQLTDSCEENSLFRWPEACVLLLLSTYEEMEGKFNNGKFTHKKCWELLAQVLKDKGYNVMGPQCSSKFRGLKKTYKSIKDHNAKSGNDRRTWQYLEVMDQMFSKKAWCKPVALASSTGLSVKNVNTRESSPSSPQSPLDDSDIEKETDLPQKSRKSTKQNSVAELLRKRLAQHEEHESKRQKRHEDKMNKDQQLIDVLKQFLNK